MGQAACECLTWACEDFAAVMLGNGHNPRCEKYARSEWKVYRINDCDWYLARSLEEAIEAAFSLTGVPKDELVDDPGELSDEKMLRLKFTDDDGTKRTFAEELARRVAAGAKPSMFASTEY